MKKVSDKPFFPENGYCAIFGGMVYPDMPSDAEETLEYVMGTLFEREADMFMLRYRDEMTYEEIGERYDGLSRGRVGQIIAKVERRLRHPSRSKILRIGREAYLNSIVAKNEEKKRQYNERIAALEEFIQKQGVEIAEYQVKLLSLNQQVQPTLDILSTSIDELGLSTRSFNSLTRAGIKTIKDIMDCEDLNRVPNLGRNSVQEVQDILKAFVLSCDRAKQL